MEIIVACLLLYVGCIVFIRLRNKSTFPLKRQLTDFSTFMVPFNIPAYLLSKVPTTPRISKEYFPELKIIEDNWETIRDEALALYTGGQITAKEDLPASSFYKDNRWTSFYLKLYDNRIPSAWELAPKTMAILDQVPSLNLALFAVLMPGKRLNKHHDPFAWKDGDSILFDETYQHSAYNDTDTPRIILMTDVDRPLKLKFVQKIYWYFGRFFNRLFMIDNVDPTHTGIGNKLGKGLMAYKNFLKSVKKKNKTFYVVAKTVVILAVLYWLATLVI